MVNRQASESSLDKQILKIFEDQEEKFSFPLTTQKQARDFVRLLNHQGFNYELLSEEIGEKSEVFRGWRLGSGPDAIGRRILMRINKPIQEAMCCDFETEEEMNLCSDLVEESKAGSRMAGKHMEGKTTIIKEASKLSSRIADKPEDKPIKTGQDTYTEMHKDSYQGIALRIDGENENMKSGVEVEIASRDLEKSLEKSSPILIINKGRDIYKAKDTGQFVDHLEIMKLSPSESSTFEEHNNRKHLDKMEVLQKQSKTLETTSIAMNTELYARGLSSERKQNQDEKYESSNKNNKGNCLKKSIGTGKDIVDSKTGDDSDYERNRSEVEHKLHIENLETLKDSELNDQVRRLLLADHDTALHSDNGHRSNVVSDKNDEIRDKNLNQYQITNSDCHENKSLMTDSTSFALSPAPKHVSSEMAINSSQNSALHSDKSNKITEDENSRKQFYASSKITRQESNAQNGSILGENLKSDIIVNTESCQSRDQTTAAIADQTQEAPILNRSSPDSSTKESGSLNAAPSSFESLPQTIPVTTETISHVATSDTTKDENINENYNSDLDLENTDHSTEERTLIQKLRLLKSSEKKNGPGYLFVFSDTPAATGTGKHRIKIGVSRFPDKKFKQALLFNPDIRMVTTVAVENRKTALYIAQDQLKSMSLRGQHGWYWGSLDVVMATIARII